MRLSGGLKGQIKIITPKSEVKPGSEVQCRLELTAFEPAYITSIVTGYQCKSTTELPQQDLFINTKRRKYPRQEVEMKNPINPQGTVIRRKMARPNLTVCGSESHFLVNEMKQLLSEPKQAPHAAEMEYPFKISIPTTNMLYHNCDDHTFPKRDGHHDETPRELRTLPPNMKVELSGRSVIAVSHQIVVSICRMVNGTAVWSEFTTPVQYEQCILRMPRYWYHVMDSRNERLELMPDTQSNSHMVKSGSGYFGRPKHEWEAVLTSTFKEAGLLRSPYGITHRGVFNNHFLNEFLKLSVKLPASIINRKNHRRTVQVLEVSVRAKKYISYVGGVRAEDVKSKKCYSKKKRKSSEQLVHVGKLHLKEVVKPKKDQDESYLLYDLPHKCSDIRIKEREQSTMACNFKLDFSLIVIVKLQIGKQSTIEVSDEIPIILSQSPSTKENPETILPNMASRVATKGSAASEILRASSEADAVNASTSSLPMSQVSRSTDSSGRSSKASKKNTSNPSESSDTIESRASRWSRISLSTLSLPDKLLKLTKRMWDKTEQERAVSNGVGTRTNNKDGRETRDPKLADSVEAPKSETTLMPGSQGVVDPGVERSSSGSAARHDVTSSADHLSQQAVKSSSESRFSSWEDVNDISPDKHTAQESLQSSPPGRSKKSFAQQSSDRSSLQQPSVQSPLQRSTVSSVTAPVKMSKNTEKSSEETSKPASSLTEEGDGDSLGSSIGAYVDCF
ncbi:hypothetical protein CJI97_005395 [Candidozyma auris]|nr:hypothetical protein CJI97_005395 [[Candida] auris]